MVESIELARENVPLNEIHETSRSSLVDDVEDENGHSPLEERKPTEALLPPSSPAMEDLEVIEDPLQVVKVNHWEVGACQGKLRVWKAEHFIPTKGSCSLTFEAMTREDFIVGFAHKRKDSAGGLQEIYQVVGGAHGNTEAVVYKGYPGQSISSVFCGRICSRTEFKSYWILIKDGVICFGLGTQVGQQTLLKVVDDQQPIAVKYVAFSSWRAPVKFRNIAIASAQTYDPLSMEVVPQVLDGEDGDDLLTPEKRQEYEDECKRTKLRAERFGALYIPPDIKKYISSKAVRFMQRSGAVEPGFVTGFDLSTDAEKAKREKRMQRFDTPQFGVEFNTETARAISADMSNEEWTKLKEEENKRELRRQKFGQEKEPLNLSSSYKVQSERCDFDLDAELEPGALHCYSLDEHFQQVRTGDVLKYFEVYGPSYIEWINDSSCTVVFQDPFTVSRALIALSEEIPVGTVFPVMHKTVATKTDNSSMEVDSEDIPNERIQTEDEPVTMEDDTSPKQLETEGREGNMECSDSTAEKEVDASAWRFGLPMHCSRNSMQSWRVLLRKATRKDLPMEKAPKLKQHRYQGSRRFTRPMHPQNQRLDYHSHSNENASSMHAKSFNHKRRSHGDDSKDSNGSPPRSQRTDLADEDRERINKKSKRMTIHEDGSITMNPRR